MKKFTFLLIGLMMFFVAFAQAPINNSEQAPNANHSNQMKATKGGWTVQFTHSVSSSGTAGCETDGNYFYVTKWNGDSIFKYDMTGNYVGGFTISGVSGLRDLAYDGTYFYGGKATTAIYKMNFNANPPTLVSTITSPEAVRNICYDPTADNGNGGFWVGNWSTDLKLVSRSGATLNTIASTTHGLSSTYGTAYDTITPGGPYIWAISATSAMNTQITQVSVATGQQTGIAHDVTTDVAAVGDLGGGLWIEPNIVGTTVTLGGLIQNSRIFGYDLASVVPDSIDLAVNTIDLATQVPINQNVVIKGEIENAGILPITSFDLYYSVDGGTPVAYSVSGVNIAGLSTYNYTHNTPWVPGAGSHVVKVWTANPNGVADQYTANDTMEANTVGYDPGNSTPRMVLMETFTSSTCGPCVAGNTTIDALLTSNPNKWVAVKYQMSWPGSGDPYYTAEGGTRRSFYGVNSVPNQQIDGGYNGNSQSVTQAIFDAAANVPSFVHLYSTLLIDTATNHVTVEVSVVPGIDLPATARLFVAILEKNTYNNTGSNGETEFHWVMKKMLPNGSGKVIGPLTSGTGHWERMPYQFNGNYRLPPNASSPINHATEHSVEEFSDLVAAVWIQNNSTKEVYQACYADITMGKADQPIQKLVGNVYPNPAVNQVNFDFNLNKADNVTLTVFNNVGQKVKDQNIGQVQSGAQKVTVDVNDLNSGVYFFRFMIGSTPYTKAVVVD